MIYDVCDLNAPVKQGDIFIGVPCVQTSFVDSVCIASDHNTIEEVSWDEVVEKGEIQSALFSVKPIIAIVITQDCDALRSEDISLCEIKPFKDVEGRVKSANSPRSFMSIITTHSRLNNKWFYLPPDEKFSISEKMAVNFLRTMNLSRLELERYRNKRAATLNSVAKDHFRERLAHFYRRYAYDEWYPLNKEELETYKQEKKITKESDGFEAYPWQEP